MIGTPYLRAYMHGFFMDMRLYRKVMDIANPFGYKDYIRKRIQEKREQLQATRITKTTKTIQANRLMAERMQADLDALQKKREVVEATSTDDDVAATAADSRTKTRKERAIEKEQAKTLEVYASMPAAHQSRRTPADAWHWIAIVWYWYL